MKQKQFWRLTALFLTMLLATTPLLSPLTVAAAEFPESSIVATAEAPSEAPAEEPTVAPSEEATEAPTEEPTKAPAEESTETPTEESTKAPAEDPTEDFILEPSTDYVPEYVTMYDIPEGANTYSLIPSFYATAKIIKGTSTSGYRSFNGFRCFGIRNGQLWDRWGGNTGSSGSNGRVAGKIIHFIDEQTGSIAYCIQPSVTHTDGTQYSKVWSDDLNIEFVKADPHKRVGVIRALVYGAPNNGKRDLDSVVGTHLLVLDIMCGYVDENLNSRQGKQTYNNCGAVPAPYWYNQGTSAEKAAYDEIVQTYQNRASHNNIPSFCSRSSGSAVHTLEKDGSQYSITLSDSNGVLADYNFVSNISGVSFSQSGNHLTITATADAAKQLKDNPVEFQASGRFYEIDDGPSGDIRLYSVSSSSQHMAMLAEGHKDAVPAYFSLTADVISEQKFSLYKGINASQSCIDQIKDNAMYTLAGAEYEVLMDGEQQEVLVTDENGYAASSKAYPIGTTLSIREIKAPSGFQLDKRTYSLTIKEGNNRIDVSDIPVFDPPFAITKVDKNTTTPQGNSSFYDAVFKWEYFDNASWSGAPKRTWYFRTNTQGRSEYNSKFLAPGYNSDPLYEKAPGNYQIPMGTVTITEIANPIGYVVVPHPLKCSIVQDGNDAKVKWEPDAWEYILDAAEGNFHIIEDIDKSLFGSLILDKIDSVSDAIPQGDGTLAGAKFEVVNNSANSVVVDGTTATPGEVCYEFTTDENGHFESGKIFPLGDYTVREAQAPDGHVLNSDWSGKFSITKDQNSASFTGPNACPDTPIYGGLKIIKQDADLGASTSADEPLDGIQFEIANASTNPVTVNGTSYANGETIMTLTIAWDGTQWSASTGPADLPYGTYTVTEVESKPGMANDYYQYDATVHTVEIREQDVVVEAVHQNPIAPGRIEIHKVDPIGKPLAGAKFCLEWSEDGSSWKPVESSESLIIKGGCTSPNLVDGCLVSGADGLVTFEGLYPTLQYRLTEVEAPDGYVLLSKPAFEGLLPVEDLTVTLTVHNSYGFTFPTTGSNAMQRMALIGTLITLLSGAAMIYPLRHWKGKLDK